MNRFAIFVFDTPGGIYWLLRVASWLFQVIFLLSQVRSSLIQVEILFACFIVSWLAFRIIFVWLHCKVVKLLKA
jgi:hypothetical protein